MSLILDYIIRWNVELITLLFLIIGQNILRKL